MVIHILELFIMLIGAHFICDYVLQGSEVALGKNKSIDPARHGVPWYYWMTSHASTHAFSIGLITGSVWFGVFEFITHWVIDALKCDNRYGIHVDQLLHLLVKLLISILAIHQVANHVLR